MAAIRFFIALKITLRIRLCLQVYIFNDSVFHICVYYFLNRFVRNGWTSHDEGIRKLTQRMVHRHNFLQLIFSLINIYRLSHHLSFLSILDQIKFSAFCLHCLDVFTKNRFPFAMLHIYKQLEPICNITMYFLMNLYCSHHISECKRRQNIFTIFLCFPHPPRVYVLDYV